MDGVVDCTNHFHHPTSEHAVRTESIALLHAATQRRMAQQELAGLQHHSTIPSISVSEHPPRAAEHHPRATDHPPRSSSFSAQSADVSAYRPRRHSTGFTFNPACKPLVPASVPPPRPTLLPSPPLSTSPEGYHPRVGSPHSGPPDAAGSHHAKPCPGNVAQPCQSSSDPLPHSGPLSGLGSLAVGFTGENPGEPLEATPPFWECETLAPSTPARSGRMTLRKCLAAETVSRYGDLFEQLRSEPKALFERLYLQLGLAWRERDGGGAA